MVPNFLAISKICGYNEISFIITENCFNALCDPLEYLLILSIDRRIFSDDPSITI